MLRPLFEEVAEEMARAAEPFSRWFRPKPPSDIAQALLDLMADDGGWTRGILALNHERAGVRIACNGFTVVVTAGAARMKLEGRDRRQVESAYGKLKQRMARRRQALAAHDMREALQLPAAPEALPAPAETMETVEARVRRLREAMAVAA